MSNSVKRFEVFRMFFAIVISLLISFVIIFLVSKEPLTAIYTLITGPFKSRRNFANVIEAMIPLMFTGIGVCIMFSANQINLAGEGAFHLGGLVCGSRSAAAWSSGRCEPGCSDPAFRSRRSHFYRNSCSA